MSFLPKNKIRVLVTGATGGLGRNAVEYLLAQGFTVRATGRNVDVGKILQNLGADFIHLDLVKAGADELCHLMDDVQVVWHCAALSAPWGRKEDFIASNVQVTQKLLHIAASMGISRFIHISTPAIYFDFQHHLNIKENYRASRYVNEYAHTKGLAEDAVQIAVATYPKMRSLILRPRAIFGEYDQVLIPRLARILSERHGRLPLPRGGAVKLDLSYVGNVVHAMWCATIKPNLQSGAVFNITNHQPVILKEVLQQLFVEHLRQPMHIVNLPYGLLNGLSHVLHQFSKFSGKEPLLTAYSIGALNFDMTLNNDSAISTLGYRPIFSMQEGISRTAQWIKSQEETQNLHG